MPDEAAGLVRALLTADRNQRFARSRMTEEQRAATPEVDFRPFIIADADTGHGGDAHVRNLIRRFVEVGVPGYHIEDQKPGAKKCGHQGGKVLVSEDEQIKRLNAARFQLDIMGVPGIIVARTDAEAANLPRRLRRRARPALHPRRHQPLPCRPTRPATWPSCAGSTAAGVDGHQRRTCSTRSPTSEYAEADAWLDRGGPGRGHRRGGPRLLAPGGGQPPRRTLDTVVDTRSSRPGRPRPA